MELKNLSTAVLSFYLDSRMCLMYIYQTCMYMSPILSDVYMDGVVREVNARVLG